MKPFVKLDGVVMPIDRNNVDTDAIIPKQFLKESKEVDLDNLYFMNLDLMKMISQ